MTLNRVFTLAVTVLLAAPIMTFTGLAEAAPAAKSEASAAAARVSLNKADAKGLMQVKGMSAYKAHAIVAYRNQNGGFKTMEDLAKVKGFKRMKPESIKLITDQLLLD